MRVLTVSFGKGDKAAITAAKSLTWASLAKSLTTLPPGTTDKASRGWYIPATFNAAHRHGDNFVSRDAITFDFDHVNPDTWGNVILAFEDIAFAMYTTYSHTDTEPRFRVVIPLSRQVSEDEYQAVSRKLAGKVGIDLVAAESFAPCQMMYLPTRTLGGAFEGYIGRAEEFADVDAVLGKYNDWTDRKEWPRRAGEQEAGTGERVDPRDKPGIIGEFNRKFTVPKAIQRFDLPYTPTNNPNRYTYKLGSVAEGVIIYDEGLKFHSHHDTDPCRGQHNSFDLVRITRFGHLDTGRPESIRPSDRPSYRAMVDFVLSLPEFRSKAADEFVDCTDTAGVKNIGPGEVNDPRMPARFVVQSAADFSGGPPLAWIVRSLLPRAELAVMYGESGSGKSFLALDMCAAISRGVEWRGRRTTHGKVVYVCAEGAGGFKARLRAYARGHNVDIHELPGVIGDAPNLLNIEDAGALYGAILTWGKPDVVVIDTLSATTPGGNENSGEDVGRVISHCKLLSKKTGALVVLIHHSGKDASKGARGWSGLRAAADAEIEITRIGDYRTAAVTKMKDGSDGEQFAFKLKVIELESVDGEPQSSCVIEHVDNPAEKHVAKRQLTGTPKLVHGVLAAMAPSGTCDYNDLIEGVKKQLPDGGEGKDTRRQDIRRAVEKSLIPGGYAYMHEGNRIGLTGIQSDNTEWLNEVT